LGGGAKSLFWILTFLHEAKLGGRFVAKGALISSFQPVLEAICVKVVMTRKRPDALPFLKISKAYRTQVTVVITILITAVQFCVILMCSQHETRQKGRSRWVVPCLSPWTPSRFKPPS
jgi:hypothetical protein